jgi:transcriptional regulator with XRE-family HTH domain
MPDFGVRREVAEFLKVRRQRLSPEDFGFPATARRRTPGLRREEVAALAGVGLTWYTWLEQGREIQVSAVFLENLARALKFSADERAHLYALTRQHSPPLAPVGSASVPTAELQAILDTFDSPAYARNELFDVVAWNSVNTETFGNFGLFLLPDRNVLRLMFTRGYHRRTMPNWGADARSLLAKFRMNLGRAADKAPFFALERELSRGSDDFRRLWAEHEVSDPGEGVTHFLSPRRGEIWFRHHTLMPEAWPDLRIVVFISTRLQEK